MVTMLVYPPIPYPEKGIFDLTADELERIEFLIGELGNLFAPMARIAVRDTLEELLRSSVPRYLTLKRKLLELLWPLLSNAEQASRLYEFMRELCELKGDLLGENNTRILVATIDSAEGLNGWASALVREGGPAAYRLEAIQQQVGKFVLHADMCINTLMMVLSDQLKDWEPGSLEILVSAADEHMTEIEDVFLASTSVSDDAEETVPFSSLRKDLEI